MNVVSAQMADHRDGLLHHEAQLCQVLPELILSRNLANGHRLAPVGHSQRHHVGLLSLLVSQANQSGLNLRLAASNRWVK